MNTISNLNFIDYLHRNSIDVESCIAEKVSREYAARDKREDKTPVVMLTGQVRN